MSHGYGAIQIYYSSYYYCYYYYYLLLLLFIIIIIIINIIILCRTIAIIAYPGEYWFFHGKDFLTGIV